MFDANEVWNNWTEWVDAMGEVLADFTGNCTASSTQKLESQAKAVRKSEGFLANVPGVRGGRRA